jgi:hypothetical protein
MPIIDPCREPTGSYCVEHDPMYAGTLRDLHRANGHFWDGVASGVVLAVAIVVIIIGIIALRKR